MSTKIILYADSNEKERRLYAKAMKGAGYSIMDFNKGQPLLEKLSVIEPRLIMLEIDLLQVDGLDICEHVRKIVRDKFPIVFFTKSDTISNLEQAIDAGGDDFLLKSGPSDLLKRLNMWSQKSVRLGISERRKRTKKRITKLKEFIAANGMDGTSIADHIDHVLGWEATEIADNGGLGDLDSLSDFNTPIDDDYFGDMGGLSQDTSDFFSGLDAADMAPREVKPKPKPKPKAAAPAAKPSAPAEPAAAKPKQATVRKEPVLDKKKLEQPVKKAAIAAKPKTVPKAKPKPIQPAAAKHRTMGIPSSGRSSDPGEQVWGQPSAPARKPSKKLIDSEWEGTNALKDGVEAPNPKNEDASDFWDMLEDNDADQLDGFSTKK